VSYIKCFLTNDKKDPQFLASKRENKTLHQSEMRTTIISVLDIHYFMRASGLGYGFFSVCKSGSGSRLFFATADPPAFFTYSKFEKCLFLLHASTIVTDFYILVENLDA
jgi:hypothetical protein